MRNLSSLPMWKRVIFPTVIMAVLWLMVSGATTYYIYWLTRSYQRVFDENVEAIYSLGRIQSAAWRALTDASDRGIESKLSEQGFTLTLETFPNELTRLKRVSFSDIERNLVAELEVKLHDFQNVLRSLYKEGPELNSDRRAVQTQRLTDLTREIAITTDQLSDVNQRLAADANRNRNESTITVFLIRTSILIFGPSLGIAYGWWMARRLQRSVARITVMLRDAPTGERTLGAVDIDGRQDLDAIQSQVEQVVGKLQQANEELKQARGEILRSERLAAVGELAAGVAHELRNPLTSVKLLLQHAAASSQSEPLTETRLNLILEEVGRMESTIQGLLDFSRPPRLNRVPLDLRDSMHRAMNLVSGRARQQRIRMSTEMGDVPLMVNADPEQLHQVFVNLLLNAVESMPEGGDLTLQADPREGGRLIEVRVRDSGRGIPDGILPRLFEPFATSKDRGTGLGLAVSRRIVADHRGTIDAHNCPGGGAEFQIQLPAA